MSNFLLLVNPKGTILTVNQTALTLLGYDESELVGQPLRAILAENEPEEALSQGRGMNGLMKAGPTRNAETNLKTKSGEVVPVLLSVSVVRDDRGEQRGMVCIGRSPTGRRPVNSAFGQPRRETDKRQESGESYKIVLDKIEDDRFEVREVNKRKALEETRRKYAFIVNTSKEFMTLIDKNRTYEAVNKSYCRAHSKTREEILGRNVADIWGEERYLTQIKQHLDRCFAGNEVHYQAWFEFAALGLRCFDVAYYPYYNNEGTVTHVVVVSRDITEHKRAEEEKERIQAQLIQAQKMEAIGILASGVAHDFNNLLTVIQGYIDLAITRIDEADSLYDDLMQVNLVTARAANLTHQLLLFSRRQPMKFALLNVNRAVDETLDMLNHLIDENIVISTDLDPDLWTVRADVGNIEQVIMNLAVNARDAMPEGGNLTLKTENVTLDEGHCKVMPEARPGKFVCLSVVDTGIGMDRETTEHIFEPFFTVKKDGNGTGLGLSVVYGIVQKHEGWIYVTSEPGQGSTFKVYLPGLPGEPADEPEKATSLHDLQGSGERILMVEDEENIRKIFARALRENGYVVFEAASVEEAMAAFERERGEFDLVFSDAVLSDTTGLELVEELLSRQPELSVLLSSGYTGYRAQRSIMHKGKLPFLEKPYDVMELLQAIREAMKPN
jgi:two-component system cell cycle sensor histidine kinase/response regulator CckA